MFSKILFKSTIRKTDEIAVEAPEIKNTRVLCRQLNLDSTWRSANVKSTIRETNEIFVEAPVINRNVSLNIYPDPCFLC